MDVTLEAAPTTPEMTLFFISGLVPSLHLTASSSIFVIEPEIDHNKQFQFQPFESSISLYKVLLKSFVRLILY